MFDIPSDGFTVGLIDGVADGEQLGVEVGKLVEGTETKKNSIYISIQNNIWNFITYLLTYKFKFTS